MFLREDKKKSEKHYVKSIKSSSNKDYPLGGFVTFRKEVTPVTYITVSDLLTYSLVLIGLALLIISIKRK